MVLIGDGLQVLELRARSRIGSAIKALLNVVSNELRLENLRLD
jgi:hypothetical protein